MADNELKKKEERKKELEMLALKKEIDAQFAANEEEKRQRKFGELKNLSDFHLGQTVTYTQPTTFKFLWNLLPSIWKALDWDSI